MTRWLLDVQGLDVTVGTVPVLHGVGVQLDQGRAVAVVGANGAGKSTLLRTIMGLLRPDAGRIHLAGMPLDALRADQRARAGIGYCPEGRRVFPGLTVIENLQVASWEKRMSRQARLREVFELFPPLGVRRRSLGWELSGGQQQMLAIGRSLMNRPRVLLLDEPCLGLSPKLAAEVSACIAVISGSGTAVLLAEQSPARALAVCDSAIVLKSGRVVASGAAAMLRDGDAIRDAVLGR